MPRPCPQEVREDVIRVARNRWPGDQLKTIDADFRISESCLAGWLKTADVEDGIKPGTTAAQNEELKTAKRRIRLLEHDYVKVTWPRPDGQNWLHSQPWVGPNLRSGGLLDAFEALVAQSTGGIDRPS